ncbi:MAG: alkaline phosphatase family protein [Actinobacteria bacterium]|nr:alkaline phosphatase family protein [Actinomycetota bacterium]MBW3648950.1 alkaline phosphatase family protein [Actinomycetota bacterium]
MPRVAALAIDAAEWWLVERLAREGRLPHLSRIREEAVRCRLRTEVPYRSELVWRRFLTGRDPTSDNLWAPGAVFCPETYASYSIGAPDGEPFYALGPRRKVISFDLIHSTIEDGVEGVQVTGWGAHSPQYPRSSRPGGLLRDIDARFGVNPAFGNDFDIGWFAPRYIDNLTEASLVGTRRRVRIAEWLQGQVPDWDLLLLCMSEVHSTGHHLWHGVDERHPLHGTATSDQAGRRMREVLQAIDEAVGTLVEALPPDTALVVFALHGMQPADDLVSTVLVPELLHRQHFGRALLRDPDHEAWRRRGCPPIVPGPEESWHAYMRSRFTDGGVDRARSLARRVLSPRAYERLRTLAGKEPWQPLGSLSTPVPPEVEPTPEARDAFRKSFHYQVASWYERYWHHMPAFALPSFGDGHIRVNLRGREASGVVHPDDYRRACDDVTRFLSSCRDVRTGHPVVRDVIRLRADDPFDPSGPDADLLVLWDGAPDALAHPTLGAVGPYPHARTSAHSPNGFALVRAPGIAPGDLGERSASDLTPTLLHLLGEVPGPGTRGRPLVGVLDAATFPA